MLCVGTTADDLGKCIFGSLGCMVFKSWRNDTNQGALNTDCLCFSSKPVFHQATLGWCMPNVPCEFSCTVFEGLHSWDIRIIWYLCRSGCVECCSFSLRPNQQRSNYTSHVCSNFIYLRSAANQFISSVHDKRYFRLSCCKQKFNTNTHFICMRGKIVCM